MRSLATLSAAFLLIITSTAALAQYVQIDPRILPAQIAAQQNIVQAEPGRDDLHAWLKLAVLLQDAGHYTESEAAYHHTVTLLRDASPLTVADVFDHMGTLYVVSGQLSKAEPLERHALEIRIAQHDRLGAGVSHMHLGMMLLGQHQFSSAETEARTAVDQLVPEYSQLAAVSSATPEEKMTALIDLSLVRCASGSCGTAIPSLHAALAIAHANYSADSVPVGYLDFLIGYANWKTGNLPEAGQQMDRGIHELAADVSPAQPAFLSTLLQYRAFLLETNRPARAKQISAEFENLSPSTQPVALASQTAAPPPDLAK